MPNFDLRCTNEECRLTLIDVVEPCTVVDRPHCSVCGGSMQRVWIGKPSSVIGDECDVWIKHGICNEDGTPRHYRFKSEMRRVAKERGLVNRVEHVGARGSDKSEHTTPWF